MARRLMEMADGVTFGELTVHHGQRDQARREASAPFIGSGR